MKYLIVAISDLHFNIETNNYINNKKEAFLQCINSLVDKSFDNLIFVVNGDISDRGKKDEYLMAQQFFNYIRDNLSPSISNLHFIFVPGNHDFCNDLISDAERAERNEVLNKNVFYLEDFLSKEHFFTKPFINFEDFTEKFNCNLMTTANSIFKSYLFSGNGHRIKLVGLNSALLFDLKETKMKLVVDEEFINNNLKTNKNEITIFLSHYPVEWFNRNRKSNYNALYSKSDILIVGHEHNGNIETLKNLENKTHIVRLPSFGSYNESEKSGFNVLEIDSLTSNLDTKVYEFDGIIYKEVNNVSSGFIKSTIYYEHSIIPISREKYNSLLNSNLLPFESSKFKEFDEVFSSPYFSKTIKKDGIIEEEYLDFSDLKYNKKDSISIFCGNCRIGKTFLLKKLFKEYYALGYIPVYIQIKNSNNKILNQLTNFINEYYGENNYDLIMQNKNKIVLLIDDIHMWKGNIINCLNEIIDHQYYNIYCTFNTEINDYETYIDSSLNINKFKIMGVNNTQTYDMIERWCVKDNDLIQDDLDKLIYNLKTVFDKNLSNVSFKTPELLWIFLDAYENNSSNNLIRGSKGVYYDYLFNKYILDIDKISTINDEQFIRSYLSHYAYCLICNNEVSNKNIYKIYLEENEIPEDIFYVNVKKLEQACEKIKLFVETSTDNYKFYNTYGLSYFCSKYFTSHLEEKENEIISWLDRLDDINIANTVLFLVHETKSKKIIEKIIEINKKLFSNLPLLKCDEDISLVNNIIADVYNVEKKGTVKENNLRVFKEIDKKEINKYKKQEKNVLENELLSSKRINDITKEILMQNVTKTQTRELISSSFELLLRRATIPVIFFYNYLKYINTLENNQIENMYDIIEKRIREYIVIIASLIMDIAENCVPLKYQYVMREIINSNNAININLLLDNILEIISLRGTSNLLNYNKIIKYRDKLIDENQKFCLVVLYGVINKEINYVGMEANTRRILLEKLNANKTNFNCLDPVKRLNQSKKRKDLKKNEIKGKK